jgi:hypothetical protein
MTQTGWNRSGAKPTSPDVRLIVSLSLLALMRFAAAHAADRPAGPFLFTSSPTRAATDIEVQTRVRRALGKDAQLASLNLGVHMSGGIAKLSGPVPSVDLKQRAIQIAGKVQGVLEVNARDLYLSSAAQGAKRLSIVIPDDRPTQTRAASPHSRSNDAMPLRDAASTDHHVTLLAPEMAAPPARSAEPARLTAHPRPRPPAVSLAPAVERLRRREMRFQQIRVQVEDATVRIFPSDTRGEDVMAFAQAVRRLPGVQHVIVASGSR